MPQTDPAFPPADWKTRLRPWLGDILLPYWATRGFDAENGAFVEQFDASGVADSAQGTRVRVQARQIYVFSHAAVLGLCDSGLAPARRAFDFLNDHAWDRTNGGWCHRLDYDGRVLDPLKDSYDHAFVLLGLAWLYRATGDGGVLRRAEETAAFLEQALGRKRDGTFDGYAEHLGAAGDDLPLPRRQNPHMHLLEAFLALHEATGGDARWLDAAHRIYGLFQRTFFDTEAGQLIEFFDRDWREAAQDGRQLREPGHFFEWVWLLHRYAAAGRDDAAIAAMRPLYDWAWQHGVDRDSVVFLQLDSAGQVLEGGSKRLWPQTEAVKACLAVYERFGDAEALARARQLLAALFTTFAGLDRPDWREQVGRDGALVRPGMPASSLYHLFLASAEVLRVLPEN